MPHRQSTTRKPFKAVVGAAHHALRAYCKAYDLRSEGTVQHRYFLAQDGRSAAILDGAGNLVESRCIEDWAAIGPQVRHAIIALKFFQEKVRSVLSESGTRMEVRYYLNILSGRSCLLAGGVPVSKDALCGMSARLSLGATTGSALAALPACALDTVEGWASLGKQVEVDFFQILQTAERYRLHEAAAQERERGYRLSIIRRPKA